MGRREEFDIERVFAANRDFLFGGKQIKAGDSFNEKQDGRRFKQLYDSRYLKMLPPEFVLPKEADPEDDGRPKFAEMEADAIRAWMRENGILAHPRLPKPGLIRKAVLLWEEMKTGVTRPPLPPEAQPAITEVGSNGVAAAGAEQLRQEGSGEGVQRPAGARRPAPRTRIVRR